MPFCTIEEAWAPSYKLEEHNDKNYAGYNNNNTYSEINLKNSELHDSKGNSLRVKKKKKKKKKKPNFSRTYNRLSEHSGPPSRLPKTLKKRYSRKNSINKLDNSEGYPNYMNGDLPINDINSYTEQQLKDAYKNINKIDASSIKESFFDNESNMETDVITENTNYDTNDTNDTNDHNNSNEIKDLLKENIKLKNIIKDLKSNTPSNSYNNLDNYIELFIFIFTGIIIIFILDNLSSLLKNRF